MKFRKIANTDLEVSIIAFGCWAIVGGFNWGTQDESDSLDALRTAYDAGINFFDTAELYGNGYSEQLIRKALGGQRDRMIIAGKVATYNFREPDLRRSCERSLRNLGTDYLDLYQLHWPENTIPIDTTLAVMEELKQKGKIRYYGVSNFGKHDLTDCLAAGHVVSNQMAYSLLFRAIEYDVLPLCLANNVDILCYSPLMQGLLTGKFNCVEDVPAARTRTRHFSSDHPNTRHGEAGAERETFEAIERIKKIAEGAGIAMGRLSLAWLLAQPGIAAALVGGRNAAQAAANAAAGDLTLTPDILTALSRATLPLKQQLGPNPDMWETTGHRIR